MLPPVSGRLTWTLVVAVSLLLVVWPVPGTIALRHLLLLLAGSSGLVLMVRHAAWLRTRQALPLWLLMAAYPYMLLHALILSDQPSRQWEELSGPWLRILFSIFAGCGLGLLLLRPDRRVNLVLYAGMFGTTAIYTCRYAMHGLQTGDWMPLDFFTDFYRSKMDVGMYGMLFLAVALARITHGFRQPEVGLHVFFWLAAALLVLLMFLTANTKSGIALFVLLATLTTIPLVLRRLHVAGGRLFLLLSLGVSGLVAFAVYYHLEKNPAWQNLITDFRTGIDIEAYDYWKQPDSLYSLPVGESGQAVNPSTYLRAAWLVAGTHLLLQHPLGLGQFQNAFGILARDEWPQSRLLYSHSGWLDMALAMGLPGIILLGGAMLLAFVQLQENGAPTVSWRSNCRFILLAMALYWLIAEAANTHYIETLFFLLALSASLTQGEVHRPTE